MSNSFLTWLFSLCSDHRKKRTEKEKQAELQCSLLSSPGAKFQAKTSLPSEEYRQDKQSTSTKAGLKATAICLHSNLRDSPGVLWYVRKLTIKRSPQL